MTDTTEWADAKDLLSYMTVAAPGAVEAGESVNTHPAVVFENGCSHRYVIEGERNELIALFLHALTVLNDPEAWQPAPDPNFDDAVAVAFYPNFDAVAFTEDDRLHDTREEARGER